MTEQIGFLFDLDGVLIDSETEYSRIWHHINEVFPTGQPDLEHVIKGCTLKNILDTHFQLHDREKVSRMLYDLAEDMEFRYIPGAEELIGTLCDRNLPKALVTSSDSVKMEKLYAQLPKFRDCFDAIVIANMVTHSKPHPQGYLMAAEMIGVTPRRCAVFEDSLQGVRAGKAAGAFVVGISATLGREKIEPEADMTVASVAEIDLNRLVKILQER